MADQGENLHLTPSACMVMSFARGRVTDQGKDVEPELKASSLSASCHVQNITDVQNNRNLILKSKVFSSFLKYSKHIMQEMVLLYDLAPPKLLSATPLS